MHLAFVYIIWQYYAAIAHSIEKFIHIIESGSTILGNLSLYDLLIK